MGTEDLEGETKTGHTKNRGRRAKNASSAEVYIPVFEEEGFRRTSRAFSGSKAPCVMNILCNSGLTFSGTIRGLPW